MRNGGAGFGWYEEEDYCYGIKEVEIILLMEKLEEVWRISRERKKEMDSKSII